MKRLIAPIAAALIGFPAVAAADEYFTTTEKPDPAVLGAIPEGMARVQVCRAPAWEGGGRKTWAFLDDRLLMVSREKACAAALVPEGAYTLWIHATSDWANVDEESNLRVALKGGETRYFEIGQQKRLFRVRLEVLEIDAARAAKLLEKCKHVEATEAGRARAAEIVAEVFPEARQAAQDAGTEGLAMPFVFEDGEQVWQVGNEVENERLRVMELVRGGETVESWTELVTLLTLKKAAGIPDLDEHLASLRSGVTARCPDSALEVLRQEPDGALYELRVAGCEQGADEHIVARIVGGEDNRFIVQYAVRAPVAMTTERREEWIGKLLEVGILRGAP